MRFTECLGKAYFSTETRKQFPLILNETPSLTNDELKGPREELPFFTS